MTHRDIHDEIAHIIGGTKDGEAFDAVAYSKADAILTRYDLVPKGSVVVPAAGIAARQELSPLPLTAGTQNVCLKRGDDDYKHIATRSKGCPEKEWSAFCDFLLYVEGVLLAARPGASHE